MATQYTTDIPFSASHTQQAFKLLELPPELLALLESENPPTFTITSSASPSPSGPSPALLCHGTKKYQLRQKNTSNPILILQPSSTGPSEADDAATFIAVPSITTVAKIEDTIELILLEEEGKAKVERKVNKWHEKFAKTRK